MGYNCNVCGGTLPPYEKGAHFVQCVYCGNLNQPLKSSDKERQINRAIHFRQKCQFDIAMGIYQSLLADTENDPEIYWQSLLCKYGIEYVEDSENVWIPTCHRVSYDPIMQDDDFIKVLELSDSDSQQVYREKAGKIESVRQKILSVANTVEPCDIFICYKESDEGGRTEESLIGQDLYGHLTGKGFRVFFSRVSLMEHAGENYEPYIFAALNTAKIMLVLSTSAEHMQAVWVKNEWSRYYRLWEKDPQNKMIIPVIKYMLPEELPTEFSNINLEAICIESTTWLASLDCIIQKRVKGKARAEERIIRPIANVNEGALLSRGNMSLEDGEWKEADTFFEQVLNINAENARAYVGKMLVENKCPKLGELSATLIRKTFPASYKREEAAINDFGIIEKSISQYTVEEWLTPEEIQKVFEFDGGYDSSLAFREKQYEEMQHYFQNDKLVIKIMRFGDSDLKAEMHHIQEETLSELKSRVECEVNADNQRIKFVQMSYEDFLLKCQETVKEKYVDACKNKEQDEDINVKSIYNEARNMISSKDKNQVQTGIEKLCSVRDFYTNAQFFQEPDYMELSKRINHANKRYVKLKRKPIRTFITVILIILTMCGIIRFRNEIQYQLAKVLINAGMVEDAAKLLSGIDNYKDSEELSLEAKYRYAKQLIDNDDVIEGVELLNALGTYKDAKEILNSGNLYEESEYRKALNYYENSDYVNALPILAENASYKDCSDYLHDAAKGYLHGYWECKDEVNCGIMFSEDGFASWGISYQGISGKEKYVYKQEYPITDYTVGWRKQDGQLAILVSIGNGEGGQLTCYDLKKDSMSCEGNGEYIRH